MYEIGVLSRWKATCGVSMHAEMIVGEFLRMGHDVTVFAPRIESANRWWHHRILGEDEDFVVRCYDEVDPSGGRGGIDFDAVLSHDFDLFIVESYQCLPYPHVEKMVWKLREKGTKVFAVIHEGRREDVGYSSLNSFDAVIVFDRRYVEMLSHDAYVVPYPRNPVVRGNRRFGEDGIVLFSFGRQPVGEYLDYVRAVDWLSKRYDVVYRVVRSDGPLPFDKPWLRQERRRLSNEEVYEALHGSDIHLIPKGRTNNVVVSSTLCQCLGAMVPTVVPNTRHFETLPEYDGFKPAVIYEDLNDLKAKLVRIIEDGEFRKNVLKAAERFVNENRKDKVAKRILEIFESVQSLLSITVS